MLALLAVLALCPVRDLTAHERILLDAVGPRAVVQCWGNR